LPHAVRIGSSACQRRRPGGSGHCHRRSGL